MARRQDWKARGTQYFTQRKYRRPQSDRKQKYDFYDQGPCEVCGKQKPLLIHEDFPRMCHSCYNLVRAFRTLPGHASLTRKNFLTLEDMKTIYRKMQLIAVAKKVSFSAIAAYLLADMFDR